MTTVTPPRFGGFEVNHLTSTPLIGQQTSIGSSRDLKHVDISVDVTGRHRKPIKPLQPLKVYASNAKRVDVLMEKDASGNVTTMKTTWNTALAEADTLVLKQRPAKPEADPRLPILMAAAWLVDKLPVDGFVKMFLRDGIWQQSEDRHMPINPLTGEPKPK